MRGGGGGGGREGGRWRLSEGLGLSSVYVGWLRMTVNVWWLSLHASCAATTARDARAGLHLLPKASQPIDFFSVDLRI